MRAIIITLLMLCSYQSLSQVQHFSLSNGLKILTKEDHRFPIAVSMLWYNVGSADEYGGDTGLSHALEHLMFKGTKKYPLGIFSKKIAAIGGQANAFTANDYTVFFEKIAAQDLGISFELEADRMRNLLLDESEFNRELKVIKEERRLRTDNVPQALAFERFLATAHLSAPYNHPVIGWMNDLKHMRVADARAWYQRFYAPNNATLVVVGDINPKDVYMLANKYFGAFKPITPIIRKPIIEARSLGKKTVEIHRSAQVPVLIIGYNVPTIKSATLKNMKSPYALEIIAAILSAGDSGRLNSKLVRGLKLASNIEVSYNLYARYQTEFMIYGSPSRNHGTDELRQGLLAEIKLLQTQAIKTEELKRVIIQIIAQKTFEKDSIFSQAMELGMLESTGLGWVLSEKYLDEISKITPKDIQETAKLFFQENNQTEATLIPEKIKLKNSTHGDL